MYHYYNKPIDTSMHLERFLRWLFLGRMSGSSSTEGISHGRRITAGIIVIGDEILKGSTQDSNSHFLCNHLHTKGVIVKRISIIGDQVPEIAEEIRRFSSEFDVVFTTGGIGPTHDDRTFEGLAAAFGDQLTPNEELRRVAEMFLRKTKLKDVNEALNKFCLLPVSASLLWGSQRPPQNPSDLNNFPSVQIRNVIALPGIPRFCEQSFLQLEKSLFPTPEMVAFFSHDLYLRKNEIHLHQKLTEIANRYADEGVTIGSYPVMGHNYYKTRLNVEANSTGTGELALSALRNEFADWIVEYDPEPWADCMQKLDAYYRRQPEEFTAKINAAMQTINDILEEYSMDKVAISFNGGKDCTLLLHLFRICVTKKFGADTPIDGFFIEGDEFPELVQFVRSISMGYKLAMVELRAKTMKSSLTQLKEQHPHIEVVLMGSRSTDPRGRFMRSKCQWTDADWPRFLRVCPLLDWGYQEIWKGIRDLCIPYCRLYDEGYSSLGERSSTAKNPALRVGGADGEERYLPAYLLQDGNLERAFREDRPENGGI